MLSLVDDARHDEKEHPKVDDGDDGLFVAAEEWAVRAQTRYELVRVQDLSIRRCVKSRDLPRRRVPERKRLLPRRPKSKDGQTRAPDAD